jgi:hypothetical protein
MSNVPSPSDASSEPKPKSGTGSRTDSHSVSLSSVDVRESVGAAFLGILSLILTFTLLRTLTRNRKLEVQLARLEKSDPPM